MRRQSDDQTDGQQGDMASKGKVTSMLGILECQIEYGGCGSISSVCAGVLNADLEKGEKPGHKARW